MTAVDALPIDPSNAAQLAAWDGGEGAYWAAHADHFDRSVAAYHPSFLAAAAVGTTDRVLDLGCGTGQTTRDAARAASSGSALGVDLSAAMLEVARRRAVAERVHNVAFEHADAQIHPFAPASFDVAISRTGAMFFGDLDAAFANVGAALRTGGRLALLTWQPLPGNEWIAALSGALAAGRNMTGPPPGAPGPFSLADPDRVRAILTRAGFTDVDLEGRNERMWFGHDADDAFEFVLGLLGWMLEGLDDAGRGRAHDALRDSVAAHETADGVVYGSAAWLIRATRS